MSHTLDSEDKNTVATRSESAEHQVRLEKVRTMRSQGIEPWPAAEKVTASCAQVVAAQDDEASNFAIAGRLMTIREHGKAIFCTLQDSSGRVQIYIKEDQVGTQTFAFFKSFIDLGDLVWVSGTRFVTKVGEVTLRVFALRLLSKCLHGLPEKFHGIADVEIKYRQRYLDLMVTPESRERFYNRSKIISGIRAYLEKNEYVEVETPMLHPIPGGAAARPFVTHHNALDMELYLRIAPELYLKRLAVGGFERVYEINRNFRNEGISTRHNPEFTMLEFYTAHKDYHYIMDFVTTMFQELAMQVAGTLELPFRDRVINFGNFRRLSPLQAVIELGGIAQEEMIPGRIDATCAQHDIKNTEGMTYHQKVFALFEKCAEHNIVDPVFIVDFPIELSPLARRDDKDPSIAARFELFIAGMELSNGFNELNDPIDQAARFKEQAQAHASGDDEAMRYDEDFVTALEHGLPPTVGVGVGIDRLVMLLTNAPTIKDVILFPTLRRKSE